MSKQGRDVDGVGRQTLTLDLGGSRGHSVALPRLVAKEGKKSQKNSGCILFETVCHMSITCKIRIHKNY